MVAFTSDLHIGHRNIYKYRNFTTSEENTQFCLHQISTLKKRDTLFILGDFIFDLPGDPEFVENVLREISKMPIRNIKLVMGNHDSRSLYTLGPKYGIGIQLPLFSYKNFWVSHPPIHPGEIRNRLGCIHGHLHGERVEKEIHNGFFQDMRYFNVNIDLDYRFYDFEEIKDRFKTS